MNHSNEYEKSKGILLFAFNSSTQYIDIAIQTSKLIKKTLDLPITIVTDVPVTGFDNNIVIDNTDINYKSAFDTSAWKNLGRYLAYDLSPYDETILLDVDYLVLSKNIINQLSVTHDYKIMTKNKTLSHNWDLNMGTLGIPYKWATVVMFKKTKKSKMLFDLVGKIQRNYNYYRKLYNIREGNFRNDYAFTVADIIINGYYNNTDTCINTSMITVENDINELSVVDEFIYIKECKTAYVVPRHDLHIMDKQYLLSDNFKKFIDKICE